MKLGLHSYQLVWYVIPGNVSMFTPAPVGSDYTNITVIVNIHVTQWS